jgi:hypothetical protein
MLRTMGFPNLFSAVGVSSRVKSDLFGSSFSRQLIQRATSSRRFSENNDGSIPPTILTTTTNQKPQMRTMGKHNLHLRRHRMNGKLLNQSTKGREAKNT